MSEYEFTSTTATVRNSQVMAQLPGKRNAIRYLQRVVFDTSLDPSDLLNPLAWSTQVITAYAQIKVGNTDDRSSFQGLYFFGHMGSWGLQQPIQIPLGETVTVWWPTVKAASASKCKVTMELVTL